MTDLKGFRHPVRPVNHEVLSRLTLEDATIRPLPGASGRRPQGEPDSRLSHLVQPQVGLGEALPDEVTFYEHLATVRYKNPLSSSDDQFFVAFRQTMDALLLEQSDKALYPEHVMKSDVKKTELKIYIYAVKCAPRQVPILRSHEDWLVHIADPVLFDTIAHFLLKNQIISEEMYGKLS
jgi:hypothetical protein